ncbi:restriction endonuclease subunit S [Streptomyces pacificus]|nr:restriction endonuclease subunit S [Streptomyces pacificus]
MAVLFEGPEKSVCSNFCARLSPAAGVDPRFLTYVLAAAYGQGLTQSAIKQTTGIQNLDTGTFFSSLWAYPRQEEQCRIADFLDAETARIDGLVTRRREMTDLLALKRERVVELALGLEHDSHAHDMAPLKYLVEGITVGIVITPAKWYVESGGTPALRGLNVRPGVIEDSDLVRISDEGDAENVKSRLRAGDVVVVRTGQAGAAAVVPPHLAGANCIDLIVVRPGRSMAPRYLEYVLNSQYAQAHVSEHAVGSIQAHFNIGSMKKIPVPSLPLARQERIVKALDERVAGLDALKDKFQQQGQMLAERRQALITAAVTGQFDVSTASGRNNTEGISA